MRLRATARLAVLLAPVALGALSGTACTRARAATAPPPLPVLAPPAPPPRLVADYPDEPAAAPTPAPAPPAPPPAPRPAPRRDPAPVPVAPAPSPAPPAGAPGALQPGRDGARSEPDIRAQLAGAERDLARLSTARLDEDARAQAATARRFLAQADDALRARNLVLAATLAEKAAAIAAALRR